MVSRASRHEAELEAQWELSWPGAAGVPGGLLVWCSQEQRCGRSWSRESKLEPARAGPARAKPARARVAWAELVQEWSTARATWPEVVDVGGGRAVHEPVASPRGEAGEGALGREVQEVLLGARVAKEAVGGDGARGECRRRRGRRGCGCSWRRAGAGVGGAGR
jgi:hypothetical protein